MDQCAPGRRPAPESDRTLSTVGVSSQNSVVVWQTRECGDHAASRVSKRDDDFGTSSAELFQEPACVISQCLSDDLALRGMGAQVGGRRSQGLGHRCVALTLRQLGTDASGGGAELHQSRDVAVLLGRVLMIRVDSPDVAIAAVDASLAFPLIDDGLKPCPRALEVNICADPLPSFSVQLKGPGPIVGVRPAALVSPLCCAALPSGVRRCRRCASRQMPNSPLNLRLSVLNSEAGCSSWHAGHQMRVSGVISMAGGRARRRGFGCNGIPLSGGSTLTRLSIVAHRHSPRRDQEWPGQQSWPLLVRLVSCSRWCCRSPRRRSTSQPAASSCRRSCRSVRRPPCP